MGWGWGVGRGGVGAHWVYMNIIQCGERNPATVPPFSLGLLSYCVFSAWSLFTSVFLIFQIVCIFFLGFRPVFFLGFS